MLRMARYKFFNCVYCIVFIVLYSNHFMLLEYSKTFTSVTCRFCVKRPIC